MHADKHADNFSLDHYLRCIGLQGPLEASTETVSRILAEAEVAQILADEFWRTEPSARNKGVAA